MGSSIQERNTWRTRTTCANGSCVEVERDKNTVRLRDKKNGRTIRKFTAEEWHEFTRGIKAGHFDDPAQPQHVPASPLANFLLQVIRDATVDDASQGRVLRFWRFVRATWLAFAAVAIGGAVIVGAAVAGGAALCGVHSHVALGLGACGSATFLITATFRTGRCILMLVRALSDVPSRPGSASARGWGTRDDAPAAEAVVGRLHSGIGAGELR